MDERQLSLFVVVASVELSLWVSRVVNLFVASFSSFVESSTASHFGSTFVVSIAVDDIDAVVS